MLDILVDIVISASLMALPAGGALALLLPTLNLLGGHFTDGDYENLFLEDDRLGTNQFRLFGLDLFSVKDDTIGAFFLIATCTFFFSALGFIAGSPPEGSIGVENGYPTFVAWLLVASVYTVLPYYGLRLLYKLTKKVRQLKDSLTKHMEDKESHR